MFVGPCLRAGSIRLKPASAGLLCRAKFKLRPGSGATDRQPNMRESVRCSTKVTEQQQQRRALQVSSVSLHKCGKVCAEMSSGGLCLSRSKLLYWLPNMLCLPTGPTTTAAVSPSLRELYPVSKAIETGNLKVSDTHMIHYQIYGNPQGQPALVVHGGPGAGCYANHAYVHCTLQMPATVCALHASRVW